MEEIEVTEEAVSEAAPEAIEQTLDQTLRPKLLDDFIGQQELKDNLGIMIQAARGRNEPLEHILLYGNPGLGKTTLAYIIGREMGANVKIAAGPVLERVGDLAAILSNLSAGDILFIDEIHRLNKSVEEVLYPAMEEYALDVVIGKGPTARTLRIDLPRFTLIGATTRMSLLSSPLRDRFGVTHHLNFYEPKEIGAIVRRSANLLNLASGDEALSVIAHRARGTPRIANRLLRRVRDYAEVKTGGVVTTSLAEEALTALKVDHRGLDATDRRLLTTIIERFGGGPVGVNSVAAAIQEDEETIEDVYEPYLIKAGFLERTPRGRMVTRLGYEHLGINVPSRLL